MKPEKVQDLILQTGDAQYLPYWKDRSWKRYPFVYQGAQPFVYEGAQGHVTLPTAEGWHPGYDSQSWTIEGHMMAKESGKRYAFVHYYNYNAMGRILGFHERVLHITDVSEKKRYMATRYHFRPFPSLFKPPFSVREGYLDITYQPRGGRIERWRAKKDSSGNLIPFEYQLEAFGQGKSGEQMALSRFRGAQASDINRRHGLPGESHDVRAARYPCPWVTQGESPWDSQLVRQD